ncbi:hypothetical protein D8B26_006489 [Coccidioides posadasii str. Silveira]|uniref:uncharacterized protein n=1 Tax=Coccidioides posadasii (strain RMSCC 757 / Silveira) TaxID=443226 RepID=UPI001BEFC89D|nr:hypothetical protein D8B26_006489 [Coccidioides posadasii str. Silveira]
MPTPETDSPEPDTYWSQFLSVTCNEENIGHVLHSAGDMVSVSRENLEAVTRFDVFTSHTLDAPLPRHILRTHGVSLSFKAPHLMHAVIACSISHLLHVAPSYVPNVPAEYHWNRSISLFNKELNGPIDSTNIDAVLCTCMLPTTHAFTNGVDPNDTETWIFSPPGKSSNWLYVGGGLSAICQRAESDGHHSIWAPVFKLSDEFYRNAEFQIEDIPPAFRDLCGIGQTSDSSNNPYYFPLRTLSVLMRLEPSAANLSKLVIFFGQMLTGYCNLIQKKKPRALLILAYWFGLMCSADQWWIQDRVRSECRAISLACGHATSTQTLL